MDTKSYNCPQGQEQEKLIMSHADALARALNIDTLIIQACGRNEIGFRSEARFFQRYIWLSRTPESLPVEETATHSVMFGSKDRQG